VLTEREVSILKLMAEGFTNRQIAGKLYVSEGTIKDQLQKIMDKLGATNRVSALYVAAKERLI
jgi:two-component system, NarL family, response regulator DevR